MTFLISYCMTEGDSVVPFMVDVVKQFRRIVNWSQLEYQRRPQCDSYTYIQLYTVIYSYIHIYTNTERVSMKSGSFSWFILHGCWIHLHVPVRIYEKITSCMFSHEFSFVLSLFVTLRLLSSESIHILFLFSLFQNIVLVVFTTYEALLAVGNY